MDGNRKRQADKERGRFLCAPLALALVLFAVALVATGDPPPTHAGATITRIVNTTDDTIDGSGCEPIHCSLREAIEAANTLPPILGDRTLIHFDIPGCPPACTINAADSLPAIQATSTVVDGTTEPEYTGTPLVVVARDDALGPAVLTVAGEGITVRGLELRHIPPGQGYGIHINGNHSLIEGNVVRDNFIGIFGGGGSLTSGTISNNVLVDNQQDGINLSGTNFVVNGNETSGGDNGIQVTSGLSASGDAEIYDNTVDSSNFTGILVFGAGTVIRDNAVTNSGFHGISATTAQGVPDGQIHDNTVTGSSEIGIFLQGDNIVARDNYVAASGLEGIAGFDMEGGLIEGNTIFQNGQSLTPGRMAGIAVWSDDVAVRGNNVTANRGHGIVAGGDNVTVGGTDSADANLIGLSTGAGILVPYGDLPFGDTGPTRSGISILGNNIGPSDSIGIDIQQDGHEPGVITQNDAGDGDSGNNSLQNYPVLTAAYAASTHVEGTLNSTPNTIFRIEIFSNEECDPSNHGEGQLFMGAVETTTDGSGNAVFTFDSPDSALGPAIAATATNLATGDTSEFSQCIEPTSFPTPTPEPSPSPTATPASQTPDGTTSPAPTVTPTPTPGPTGPWLHGDINCSGAVDPVDSLGVLRHDAGLSVNKNDPDCPDAGDPVQVAVAAIAAVPQGETIIWGDVDCDQAVNPVDSLKILRYDAGLSVSQLPGCPPIGSEVGSAQ